ncbi:hypothetical protein JYK22_27240, partial [Nonomuraea sp. RK-328]|nr:hypothetical protein [Nonomuraea sp. RK-328]
MRAEPCPPAKNRATPSAAPGRAVPEAVVRDSPVSGVKGAAVAGAPTYKASSVPARRSGVRRAPT